MLSRELDAPVVSSGVKALHEEAMERAQGHTRRALLADPGGDQHLACLFGGVPIHMVNTRRTPP